MGRYNSNGRGRYQPTGLSIDHFQLFMLDRPMVSFVISQSFASIIACFGIQMTELQMNEVVDSRVRGDLQRIALNQQNNTENRFLTSSGASRRKMNSNGEVYTGRYRSMGLGQYRPNTLGFWVLGFFLWQTRACVVILVVLEFQALWSSFRTSGLALKFDSSDQSVYCLVKKQDNIL